MQSSTKKLAWAFSLSSRALKQNGFICTPRKKPLHSERKYVPLHTDSADTESYTILLLCSDWPRDSTDITILDKWMDEVQFHKVLQAISTNERET